MDIKKYFSVIPKMNENMLKKHINIKELVLNLSHNYTKVIDIETLNKYDSLRFERNGIGDRWCNKLFNYTSIYSSTKKSHKSYHEDIDFSLDLNVINDFRSTFKTELNGIIGILPHSIRKNKDERPIRTDIRANLIKQPCVVCGSHSDLIIDHKNDLYNDPRVLNLDSQLIADFQTLCNHCNLQKRQVCKREKETGIIYSAKNIQQFAELDCDFHWEPKIIDINDIDTKKGSYWYDPKEWVKNLYKHLNS